MMFGFEARRNLESIGTKPRAIRVMMCRARDRNPNGLRPIPGEA
jgi:hypothetical protein